MAPAMVVKLGMRPATLVTGVTIGLALLTSGCGLTEAPILNPKGPIALAERDILFRALAIMMIVVIPVFAMTFWFAWRYRASNNSSRYELDWASAKVDAVIWVVPALIVISLGVHVWLYTHELDPYKPLQPSESRWRSRSSPRTGNGSSSTRRRGSPPSTSWRFQATRPSR